MRAEPGGASIQFTSAQIAEYYRARVPGLKQAFGFRNFDNYRLRVKVLCG